RAPQTRRGAHMSTFDRPRQIIEFCLKPLELDPEATAYKETVRRLEHVIRTLQLAAGRNEGPVPVDFSRMPTVTINEAAHGDD
ncbi:MAG: hypothetical protein WA840_12680, partial [Caulobacteraceae bacterium]